MLVVEALVVRSSNPRLEKREDAPFRRSAMHGRENESLSHLSILILIHKESRTKR